ncbi:membrane-bound alkaline phosphatase-like [Musca vetustissima]|uniref:membrane-bound alkaline phosphatase-like n=1 Tax=Musca vetustissima TaxID=27455 RepID=UPI002AB66877|nr:membrane-bound alkaline phosphatase-like [Musca vetustissima]
MLSGQITQFDFNQRPPDAERRPEFWRGLARQELVRNVWKQNLNVNKAKNIIMFLGDGMSLSTVAAARILKGQKINHTGEEEVLSFEKFPHTGLSKTYCTNAQVADSACTATAYLCGVKTNIFIIGVTANVEFNNCTASMDASNQVSSIAAWAQAAGKSTGFITTTTLTHASPAGTYAHVANRLYESDADVLQFGQDNATCIDIAQQLVRQEPGRNFNIMMGGGMEKFIPFYQRDAHGNFGMRQDGRNLISQWQDEHPRGQVVTNRDELLKINTSEITHLMGVFQSKALDYHILANHSKQPSLSEMTEVALKLLQKNENGYFIFIEGGHIDTAHHENKAAVALEETLEFEKAIQLARDMTDVKDTLIVVTADHGHPLTMVGYPNRGNPILGLNKHDRARDGLKFSTLNYPLGPEQYVDSNGRRLNLDRIPRTIESVFPSYIKTSAGHHSGEDVGIFSSGPFAHLFTGVLQQHTIPHLMAYASCMGDGPTMCNDNYDDRVKADNSVYNYKN